MIESKAMETPRAVSWEAPAFHYTEKGADWYFGLGIIVAACVIAALLLGNFLLALLCVIAGIALAIASAKRPAIVPFAVTLRGVRAGALLLPFSQLTAYHIDEEDPRGPQLLLMSSRRFMPLIVMPIPVEYLDEVEAIIGDKIPAEYLEEPLFLKLLEKFGF
jgi:hypothetical protein